MHASTILSQSPQVALAGNSRWAVNSRSQLQSEQASLRFALVVGPEGAAKQSIARAMHANGPRRERPFVPVSCNRLTELTFDSQMFGHLPGAFAGLKTSSLGMIQAAHEGTLFLDDIECLNLEAQSKLFRAFHNQAVIPFGGSEGVPVDVNVIAATSIDLPLGITAGMFHGDFFQQLSSQLIEMPALVDRIEDVPAIAEQFVAAVAARRGVAAKQFTESAINWMSAYEWPGNEAELCGALEHAFTSDSDAIDDRAIRRGLTRINRPSAEYQRGGRGLQSPARFSGFSAMRATPNCSARKRA